jgi:hypothetical protein
MQQKKMNGAICEDESERIQGETPMPILTYFPSVCLQTSKKTTKLFRMVGLQVMKQSWALSNTKLKC